MVLSQSLLTPTMGFSLTWFYWAGLHYSSSKNDLLFWFLIFCSWVSGILFKLHTMTGTLLFLMSCFVYVRELLGDHIHCITDGADATGSLVMFFVKFVEALILICGGCVPVVSLLTNGKWFISIMTSYLHTLYSVYTLLQSLMRSESSQIKNLRFILNHIVKTW